jgi:hypothetical protein
MHQSSSHVAGRYSSTRQHPLAAFLHLDNRLCLQVSTTAQQAAFLLQNNQLHGPQQQARFSLRSTHSSLQPCLKQFSSQHSVCLSTRLCMSQALQDSSSMAQAYKIAAILPGRCQHSSSTGTNRCSTTSISKVV